MFKHLIKFKIQTLLEARTSIDSIKNIYSKGIKTEHDSLAKFHNPNEIVDHFANNADPTADKKYTHWVVSRYNKGQFRQEDHPRIKHSLMDFEQHKAKLKNKDINQYKSLSDLEDHVEPHLGTISNKQSKAITKHEGAELVHKEDGLQVHKLKTKEAACHYGAGTKWCTAAKNNNMFDKYNEKGPLYVVQHGDGAKHQFHFETNQFADKKDNMHDLSKLVQKYPKLKNVEEFKNKSSHGYEFAKTKEEFNKGLSKALDDGHWQVRYHAIQHPKANHEHISKALNDPNEDVRHNAIQHPKANHEHISKALNDKDGNVKHSAIQHPKATVEHISKALDDKREYVRSQAIQHPKATVEHISKALNDKSEYVRYYAIRHPNANHEHISKALSDKDEDVRARAEEMLSKIKDKK